MPLKSGNHDIKLPFSKAYLGNDLVYRDKPMESSNVIPEGTIYLFHFNDTKVNEIDKTEMTNVNTYSEGVFGKSANGFRNTMALIPTLGGLLNNNKLTMSFWINFKSTGFYSTGSKYEYPIHFGNSYSINSSYPVLALWLASPNKIRFKVRSPAYEYISDEEDLRNKWHHVAITFDNGVVTLFLNGKKVISNDDSITSTISFDGRTLASRKDYALIDELLITNTVLYTEDFTPLDKPYILPTEVGV